MHSASVPHREERLERAVLLPAFLVVFHHMTVSALPTITRAARRRVIAVHKGCCAVRQGRAATRRTAPVRPRQTRCPCDLLYREPHTPVPASPSISPGEVVMRSSNRMTMHSCRNHL